MSANATTAQSGLPPFYRRRRFWRAAIPGGAMLAAFLTGLALFSVFHDSSGLAQGKGLPIPTNPKTPPTVRYDRKQMEAMHALVLRFVKTAVARKNLAESYRLIGPGLKEGYTLKQWVAGNVTVVPYPVDKTTTLAFEKPDWTYANAVRFQVHILTTDRPRQVAQAGVYDFYVDLVKWNKRWVVNNFVPRWTPPIPNASG